MTISELGSIGELLAAVAVLITLVYLSLQVRQGNLHARTQVRQRMVEQGQAELYQLIQNPDLHTYFTKSELNENEKFSLNFLLTSAMRQREWEWFQYRDRVVTRDVYEEYHTIITIHQGTQRTRKWWNAVGRPMFNPDFVEEVDLLLNETELTDFLDNVSSFDAEQAMIMRQMHNMWFNPVASLPRTALFAATRRNGDRLTRC
jgi:hypothetical protein|tara:strand:+ start:6374 stop:6982 length:609 start_codon:yes stop_codon:yes gene_type:complete